jgi:hypothetical protein
MSQENQDQPASISELLEKVSSLEMRIGRIEEQLDAAVQGRGTIHPERYKPEQDHNPASEERRVDKGLIESNIFEFGMTWFGSLVLLFGIAFLSNFAKNYMNGLLATLVGYLAVAGVFFLSWYIRNSYTHLSFMLNLSAHLLVYYITLRLYFFTANPVIPIKGVVVALLLVVIAIQCYFAIKRNSELMAVDTILLSFATALFTDSTVATLPLMILTSAFSVFFLIRYGWWRLMVTTIILVYLSQIIWLLNNPIMGHALGTPAVDSYNLVSLFIVGLIYSFIPMIKQKGKFPVSVYSTTILINGISFTMVLSLLILSCYPNNYVWIFTVISLLCLVYSIILKYRITRIFDPAFYAIYSFMALSVAVYGYSKLPDAYWLLALQSLLVVSWALWFRSKIIVVMNTILFSGILGIYLAFYPSVDKVNIAFVITAFISARIINWKKERLTLQTEMIRNTYLIALFFIMLFALYHLVPPQYVALSWTAAAVFYFILSLVLKLIKYRWMAIATVLVTGFYLFFVDLSHLETGYRVLAFLFLAVISLGASMYFTKKVRKKFHPENE